MKITDYVIIMHNENLRSLSANQSRLILGMAEDARAEITKSAVVERIQVSPGYANKLLHELERKGWLHSAYFGERDRSFRSIVTERLGAT
jgi:predicted transcriptional regulator of viral defense system